MFTYNPTTHTHNHGDHCDDDFETLLQQAQDLENGVVDGEIVDVATTCPSPQTINPLISTGFVFNIAKIPSISYWCKSVQIPSLNLGPAIQGSPFMEIKHPGTLVEQDQVTITFTIDERMDNYAALYEWIMLIGFMEKSTDVATWRRKFGHFSLPTNHDIDWPDLTSDATLIIKGANGQDVRQITFRDLWITNLDGFTLNEDNSDTTYVTCTASFHITGKIELSDTFE